MPNEKEVRNIRRGQVFYLSKEKDGRTVSEPYIVLSNNRCNESSAFIHAAPVRQGEADPDRYYHCGFSGTCHKSMFVDVSRTTLISKDKFNDQTYSAAQSFYTVNNTDLLNSIEEALCQQLGITKNYVVYGETQATQGQRSQEPIQVTINMNITGLDTNATPVTVTAEPVITAVQKKEPDVFVEPEQVRKSVETVATMTEEKVTKTNKKSHKNYVRSTTPKRTRFKKENRDHIIKTIFEKSCHFNGDMTNAEIAKELGVSLTTVNRYTQGALSGYGVEYRTSKGRPRSQYAPLTIKRYKGLTLEEMETITKQYNDYGAQWLISNRSDLFNSIQSVYAFLSGYCHKVGKSK